MGNSINWHRGARDAWASAPTWVGSSVPELTDATGDGTFTLAAGGGMVRNEGTISLVPSNQLEATVFYEPTGKFQALLGTLLTWTQSVAPTLDVTAPRFVNTGLVALAGGTLDFSGTSVRNAGTISLLDVAAQQPEQSADGMVSIVATTLATRIEIAASVAAFSNSGTIVADTVQFDGVVGLAGLGDVAGALDFAGTLDLGGGTFAATPRHPVTIGGTVQHGTLAAGAGLLALDGASLRGVTLSSGTAEASGTLHVLGHGGLSIHAGAVLAASGDATLAGPSGAAIANHGTILAATDAFLTLQAGLAGAGTVELAANAVVTVGALALSARPTFLFDPGAALLSLPGAGAGVTLADLHGGDVLDFRSISSAGSGLGHAYETGDTLRVVGASGHSALVALNSPAHGIGFAVSADGHGGTLVTIV